MLYYVYTLFLNKFKKSLLKEIDDSVLVLFHQFLMQGMSDVNGKITKNQESRLQPANSDVNACYMKRAFLCYVGK